MQIESLAPHTPQVQCKICSHDAELYGVADFNKNCEERNGVFLPLSGIPVYYHQCGGCGLVFTGAFDHWQKHHFLQHIYNDDYVKVDPEYTGKRPRDVAGMVVQFIEGRKNLKLLDYGGGEGMLARLLCERGIDCKSWDPMQENSFTPEKGHFDFITSFEVFEHTPNPLQTTEEVLSFLKPETGLLLFSTVTLDTLPPRAIHWPYIAPRNGHVTIYSKKSLALLLAKSGYKVHHINDGLHLAYKTLPQFPAS